MNIKKIVGFEHNFNGHSKFKLITYLTSQPIYLGLSSKVVKKRILYVFDPEKDKKGDAKMYFINNDREVEEQLTNNEYNEVADLVIAFQNTPNVKESKPKEVTE